MKENKDFTGYLASLMKKVFLQEKNSEILHNLEILLIESISKMFLLFEKSKDDYEKFRLREKSIIQMIKDIGIFEEKNFWGIEF